MKAANKNTIPITSESDILCAFRNLTSSYDERTLHKWINFFNKLGKKNLPPRITDQHA